MNYPPEVVGQRAFYPNLKTRDEAEQMLRQNFKGRGTYVLRPSSSGDSTHISVSISQSESLVHHMKINIEYQDFGPPVYYVAVSIKFGCLSQLIHFYSTNKINVEEKVKNLKLQYPVNRTDNRQEAEVGHPPDGSEVNSFVDNPRAHEYIDILPEENIYLHPRSSQTMKLPSKLFKSQSSLPDHSSPRSKSLKAPQRGNQSKVFSKTRSYSVGLAPELNPNPSGATARSRSKSVNYPDLKASQQQQLQLLPSAPFKSDLQHPNCRPPAPLPSQSIPESDDFVYSYVNPNHDFFEETYNFLKETELCECGLRLVDSDLPLGWAVHISKEKSTEDYVFFQREDVTSWDVPQELLPCLSQDQILLILKLCHRKPSPIPPSLNKFIRDKFEMQKQAMSSSATRPSQPRLASPSSSAHASPETHDDRLRGTPTSAGTNGQKHEDLVDEDDGDRNYETACRIFDTMPQQLVPLLPSAKPRPPVRHSTLSDNAGVHNPYVEEDPDGEEYL